MNKIHKEGFVFDAEFLGRFSQLVGDFNQIHEDINYARTKGFSKPVVHGMLIASFFSGFIFRVFGSGAVIAKYDMSFRAPILLEEPVTFTLQVVREIRSISALEIRCTVFSEQERSVPSSKVEGKVILIVKEWSDNSGHV